MLSTAWRDSTWAGCAAVQHIQCHFPLLIPASHPVCTQPHEYRKLGQVQVATGKTLDEMCEHTAATLKEGPYTQAEIAGILGMSEQGKSVARYRPCNRCAVWPDTPSRAACRACGAGAQPLD